MEIVIKTPSYKEILHHIERRYNRFFWLIVHLTLAVVSAELLWASTVI